MKIERIRDGFGNVFKPDEIIFDMDGDKHITMPKMYIEAILDTADKPVDEIKKYLARQYSQLVESDFMRWVQIDIDEIKKFLK